MANVSISEENFEKIPDSDTKLNILFSAIRDCTNIIAEHIKVTEGRFEMGKERFRKLENRKKVDKMISFCGGVVGGIIAIVGKNLFGVGNSK